MRRSLLRSMAIGTLSLAFAGQVMATAATAEICKPEDIPAAVDATGATLRKYTIETQPQLQPRLKALAAKNGWGEEGYEDQAFAHLKDDKLIKLDETATQLLARIDSLGELKQGEQPDCSRVEGIRVSGVELLAVMKAKTAHVMGKIDAELGKAPSAAAAAAAAKAPAADKPTVIAKVEPPKSEPSKSEPVRSEPSKPEPSQSEQPRFDQPKSEQPKSDEANATRKQPQVGDGWSTKTNPAAATASAPPVAPAPSLSTSSPAPATTAPGVPYTPGAGASDTTIAMQQPSPDGGFARPSEGLRRPSPPPIAAGEDGYSIEEIHEATRGFFGPISTGLAQVVEHAFRKSGRPTGYVLGIEGGGAFIGGLRYGKGTLYLRSGGTETVYWHGPSLGFDFGASGTRTMFLAYKLREPDDLYRVFTGVDGSAFVVGGVGVTLLSGGNMILAPIRSGLGIRLGASIGYIRFTPQQTWNPL